MFKYGSIYKQLRKDQEITQTEACKGICSISKLSRWENNQVEVEFSTAIALQAHQHYAWRIHALRCNENRIYIARRHYNGH